MSYAKDLLVDVEFASKQLIEAIELNVEVVGTENMVNVQHINEELEELKKIVER